MQTSRLERQLEFIRETDKLKTVVRRNRISDGSRNENTAEHSWHFALMTVLLAEHADSSIDLLKAVQMALVHDLVEIDAGDTYCYDEAANEGKLDRERIAADRLFAMLPEPQAVRIREIWDEFEEGKTAEARYSRALDRLNPLMLNYFSGGIAWKKNGIRRSQVLERMGEVEQNAPALWPYVLSIIERAVGAGWLEDA